MTSAWDRGRRSSTIVKTYSVKFLPVDNKEKVVYTAQIIKVE